MRIIHGYLIFLAFFISNHFKIYKNQHLLIRGAYDEASESCEPMRVDICEMMDPRSGQPKMRPHKLFDIVVIGLYWMIVGGNESEEMRESGLAKVQWLQQFLRLRWEAQDRNFGDGISAY